MKNTARAFRTACDVPTNIQKTEPAAQEQPEYIGTYYIHNAIPMRGAKPDATGKCFFLLQCFPIAAGVTPGQIRDMRFDSKDAQYHPYYGHMSRAKGDAGMVVGYVEEMYGTHSLEFAAAGFHGPAITETKGLNVPRPRVDLDLYQPYGNYTSLVEDFDGTVRTMSVINQIRNRPQYAPKHGLKCLGG